MLEGLRVKDLAIIDEMQVNFGKNLNILTGETGAGKSIIIGSINLALGAKVGKNAIRKGKEAGYAELLFSVDEETERKLREMDIFPEEGLIVIARRIGKDRNISRVNGETVSLTKVREIASLLLDVHGQQENHSLLSEKNHLEILDRFLGKGAETIKEELKSRLADYRAKEEELKAHRGDEISRARELDFLKYECDEIEKAELKENEEEELEEKVRKYEASGKIMECVTEADACIGGREGAEEKLERAVKAVSKLGELDSEAEGLFSQISDIEALFADFKRSLSDYAEENVFDEEDYRRSERRLDRIRGIYAKHGGSFLKTMEFQQEASEKIGHLEHFTEYKDELKKEVERLKEEILKLCDRLSEERRKVSATFATEVTRALVDLNFLQVEFEVRFRKSKEFTGKGNDEISFMISANPGEPLRSIAEIASGGELSRIMLAIKTVMADTDNIPTLIFDEIDAGISGRTAQKVSEKLALLSKNRQIIAITHLAQIAAMADSHFLIEKHAEGSHTATVVRELQDEEIAEELARILGGAKITESVLESAKEMKYLAELEKKKN